VRNYCLTVLHAEHAREIAVFLPRCRRERTGCAGYEDVVDASIRQFCASARARFEACADLDAKRQFLSDHVEKMVFNHGKITITGSVPVQGAAPAQAKLPFRIEREVNRAAIRSRASRSFGRRTNVQPHGFPPREFRKAIATPTRRLCRMFVRGSRDYKRL
jgi:hypothetical protein